MNSHPLYEHIVPQITKFNSAMKNPSSKKRMVKAFYDEIKEDATKILKVQDKNIKELYKFISETLDTKPEIIIAINSKTDELDEVCESLPFSSKVIEFKTFENEDAPSVHIHLFEPVYVQKPTKPFEREILESYRETTKEKVRRKSMEITPQKEYRISILETLIELGGKGKMAEVLERVERRMGDKLTAQDREILSSGNEVRWRNHARWERKNMVDIGLLRNDSPHGVWEITKKGEEYYQSHK